MQLGTTQKPCKALCFLPFLAPTNIHRDEGFPVTAGIAAVNRREIAFGNGEPSHSRSSRS